MTPEELFRCCGGEIDEMLALGVQALFAGGEITGSEPEADYLQELKERATERMSRVGAAIRNREVSIKPVKKSAGNSAPLKTA